MSGERAQPLMPECRRVKVKPNGLVAPCYAWPGHSEKHCKPRFFNFRPPWPGDIDMDTGMPVEVPGAPGGEGA